MKPTFNARTQVRTVWFCVFEIYWAKWTSHRERVFTVYSKSNRGGWWAVNGTSLAALGFCPSWWRAWDGTALMSEEDAHACALRIMEHEQHQGDSGIRVGFFNPTEGGLGAWQPGITSEWPRPLDTLEDTPAGSDGGSDA